MSAPRPDSGRLDIGLYPFVVEVPPRFGDMDALHHLNNVALAAIYEEGRIALHRSLAADGARERGARTVIAQVVIHYLAEGFYPQTLQVAGGVARIGASSYEIHQGLFQDGRCIGAADTVIVYTMDRAARPMPQAMKDLLAGLSLRAGDKR